MRVAVCFSGGIRSFLTCYPSIYKNVIQPLNADIFMHLWKFGSNIKIHKNNDKYLSYHKQQNDECDIGYILEKSNPIKYVVHDYDDEWEKRIIDACDGFEIISKMNQHDKDYAISAMGMYYKIYVANQLKCDYENEHNFKYDLVIRIRPDFYWNENLCLKTFENIKEDDVYIIRDRYCTSCGWEGNDKFFACKSETMDKMCNLYKEIYYYYDKKICQIEGQNLNKYHIRNHDLNLIYIGDKNTYEKYSGRHRVSIRNMTYYIDGCLSFVGFHLCEKFMKIGIKIYGYDTNNSKNKNLNLEVLKKYAIFEFLDKRPNDFNYRGSIIIDNSEVLDNINGGHKIFICENKDHDKLENDIGLYNSINDVKNKFLIFNAIGPRSDFNNSLYKAYKDDEFISLNCYNIHDVAEYIFHRIYNKRDKSCNILVGKPIEKYPINLQTIEMTPSHPDVQLINNDNIKKAIFNAINWYHVLESY